MAEPWAWLHRVFPMAVIYVGPMIVAIRLAGDDEPQTAVASKLNSCG